MRMLSEYKDPLKHLEQYVNVYGYMLCNENSFLGKTYIFVITPFSPTVLGLLSLFPYLQKGRNCEVVGKTLLCLKLRL